MPSKMPLLDRKDGKANLRICYNVHEAVYFNVKFDDKLKAVLFD